MTDAAPTRSGFRLPMSWETYASLDYDDDLRGAEYMDGELVVPGLPDWGHQQTILYLLDQLRPTLGAAEGATTGVGWKPADVLEEYAPDVLVCEIPRDRRRLTALPLLCVEVTSSNRAVDMVKKRSAYAIAGLGSYWIVDRQDRVLRCHELRDGALIEIETHQLPPRRREALIVTVAYDGRAVQLDLIRLFI